MKRSICQAEKELEIAIKQLEKLRGAILNVCSLYHFTPDLWEPEQSLKRLLEINASWALDPEISSDAAKFATEKEVEGIQKVLDCRELNLSQGDVDTIKLIQEQLRKEQ